MKIIYYLLLLILLMPESAYSNEMAAKVNSCQDLGVHIKNCTSYKCQINHPNADKFIVDHEILGFKTDELLCHHTQTIPGNGIIDCKYPRAMRQIMAKQMAGTKLTDGEVQIVSQTFEYYCRVIE